MKKEFSFFEFVGIIVPSTILLFFLNYILSKVYNLSVVDFSKLGDSLIFIIIAYGFGHILQGVGNYFEWLLWLIYGGMPTNWLTKPNRFGNTLFQTKEREKLLAKIYNEFDEEPYKDYGRLIYTKLFTKKLTDRVDIFNGNYSLMRGISVSLLLLFFLCTYYFSWKIALLPGMLFIISTIRMVRFAKYYAKEIYRTYLVTD